MKSFCASTIYFIGVTLNPQIIPMNIGARKESNLLSIAFIYERKFKSCPYCFGQLLNYLQESSWISRRQCLFKLGAMCQRWTLILKHTHSFSAAAAGVGVLLKIENCVKKSIKNNIKRHHTYCVTEGYSCVRNTVHMYDCILTEGHCSKCYCNWV